MHAKQVFELLVHEHSPMLLAYLRTQIQQRDVVDELFQETMLVAWRRLDSFDKSKSFAPWLRGIARNLLLEHYRKTKREYLLPNDEAADMLDHYMLQFDQAEGDNWQEKIAPLKHCVSRLPDNYRDAVELRFLHDQKPAAIRLRLGIGEEALKKRLQRAKKLLFECMQLTLAKGAI